jgi:hypothetical protein
MNNEKKKKSIRDFPVYEKSPFKVKGIEEKWRNQSAKPFEVFDTGTGELYSLQKPKSAKVEVDTLEYRKVFTDFIPKIADLSSSGLRVLCYLLMELKPKKDLVFLQYNSCKSFCGYTSLVAVYNGVAELLDKNFIARCVGGDSTYFVNPNAIFNGNRLRIYFDKK